MTGQNGGAAPADALHDMFTGLRPAEHLT
jgi:hypothetical protein